MHACACFCLFCNTEDNEEKPMKTYIKYVKTINENIINNVFFFSSYLSNIRLHPQILCSNVLYGH